jgi:hypothetical protein
VLGEPLASVPSADWPHAAADGCRRYSLATAKVGAIAGRQREAGGIGGFGLEQAYADQPAVLVEPLDQIPVALKLAEDYGGKVNPTGAQLAERHWLLARAPQSLNHPQLLGFNERHRPDCRLLLGVPLGNVAPTDK